METVLLDVVTKEAMAQGWEPKSLLYVHRISNQMREYHDTLNVDHDLVVLDPNRMRFRVASSQEYLLERFVVAIVDAFVPIQVALTKTLGSKADFSKVSVDDAKKIQTAFSSLFHPFQAIVRQNRLQPDAKLKGNWIQRLRFSELAMCLARLKEKPFSDAEHLRPHIEVVEMLYRSIVRDGLSEMWQTFVDSGLNFTSREEILHSKLYSNPVEFLQQWVHINKLVNNRHTKVHPVTVGIKSDLEKTREKLVLMQSAAEEEWAESFRDVCEYCLIHCKYLVEKASTENEQEKDRYLTEFQKCL